MLLAQITEATRIAGQALQESAQFGAMTYVLVFFLVIVAIERGANFWWIDMPRSKEQRENERMIAQALNTFAVNDSAKTEILSNMSIWQAKMDSGMRDIAKHECRFDPARPTAATA